MINFTDILQLCQNINFIEKNLPNVLADEAAVERIVTNLLDNAIKYTKANDEGEVEIEVKKEKDFIKVLVKDLGIGIQSSDQGQVFKRFYRTPDARASQKTGSGLGLAGRVSSKQRNKHEYAVLLALLI